MLYLRGSTAIEGGGRQKNRREREKDSKSESAVGWRRLPPCPTPLICLGDLFTKSNAYISNEKLI